LRERERRALLTFYEALGGPDWIERDFWGSDRPVGEWHGVKTDEDGRVIRLTIYDNNLQGELSAAICGLARLHTLHLSFNKITGPLPDELGDCRALKNLWLKGNKLTGRLPASVAVLPALEYLDVHANDLSGPAARNLGHAEAHDFSRRGQSHLGRASGGVGSPASARPGVPSQQRAHRPDC
jgi:hypothetical protein